LGNLLYDQLGTVTSSFTRGTLSSIIPGPVKDQNMVTAFQLDVTATHGNSGGPVFNLETGKVLGVLQSGVSDSYGKILPGITKAESIYKIIKDNLIDEVLNATTKDLINHINKG
jgi:S1-C subfamily serine protease